LYKQTKQIGLQVQISIIICIVIIGRRKNNQYTNAHHTVKIYKLQHFLVLSFKKYFLCYFIEQIGLYYANEQWNH